MKPAIYYEPKRYHLATDAPVAAVVLNETGYYPIYTPLSPEELNGLAVTTEIIESAVAGSMFGWDVPGARLAREYLEGLQ